jgi:hypothetical protein
MTRGVGKVSRVPAVYLTWADSLFLPFFALNRINNLRVFSVAFSSIPTAPTNLLIHSTGLTKTARRQKAAVRNRAESARLHKLSGTEGRRRSLAIPKAQQGIFPLGQSGLDVVAAGGFYER